MTRTRLAVLAALSVGAFLAVAPGGQALPGPYRVDVTCHERHPMDRDLFNTNVAITRANATRFVPVENAKVISKLKDLTTSNGDNVVDGRDVDRTNENGVGRTTVEFNKLGEYRLTTIVKDDANVVDREQLYVFVEDRKNGKCATEHG